LKPILNAYPLPTPGAIDYGTTASPSLAQFIESYSLPSQIDSSSIRIDHILNHKIAFFFRYSDTPSGSASRTLSSLTKSQFKNQGYTFGATYQLTSAISNDFRLGYATSSSALEAELDGFGGAVPIDLASSLAPGLSQNAEPYFYLYFAGIGTASLQTLSTSNEMNSWNVVDALSVSLGKHSIKVGIDYRKISSTLNPYPFTPELSFNPSNNGDTSDPVRPSWNPAFRGQVITGTAHQYFNPNAFVVPQAGTYGNVARNSLNGPALTEWDTSLWKTAKISERLNLQLRGDAFNVLNHTNLNTPNLVVYSSATAPPSSSAGVVTSTSTTSRQLQVSAKLIW